MLALLSACGGGAQQSIDDQSPSLVSDSGVVVETIPEIEDVNVETSPPSGALEHRGDDNECPYVSTETVLAITGGSFTSTYFGPGRDWDEAYTCEWKDGMMGDSVGLHFRLKNLTNTDPAVLAGDRHFESYDSANELITHYGATGGFLEAWEVSRMATNQLFGEQFYRSRGAADVAGPGGQETIFEMTWFLGGEKTNESIALELWDAVDADYRPPVGS